VQAKRELMVEGPKLLAAEACAIDIAGAAG